MKINSRVRIYRYRPALTLRITGEDAFTFLQGQFTQDLRGCAQGAVAYGLWLTQKGKVIADSFVWCGADGAWWVVSYHSNKADVVTRLEAYVIADDVVIEDCTDSVSAISVLGEDAAEWIVAQGGQMPNGVKQSIADGGVVFAGRRGVVGGWEWVGTGLPEVSSAAVDVEVISEVELEFERIRAGMPSVPRDVGPQDLPNEGGLELVAISYSKGCYLGQEVMARLKAMGQVRRQLVRVEALGRVPAELPAALYSGGKRVGELRSAVEVDGRFTGLAMLSRVHIDAAARMSLALDGDEVVCVSPAP